MRNPYEIVEKYLHENGNGMPFVVAIVDDMKDGDTKLVIMFEDEDFTAVLSLDTLIESEDITPKGNSYDGEEYDRALREELWSSEYEYADEDEEDEDELYEDEEDDEYEADEEEKW